MGTKGERHRDVDLMASQATESLPQDVRERLAFALMPMQGFITLWLDQPPKPCPTWPRLEMGDILAQIEENERMNEIMTDGSNTLGKLNEHLFAELERLSETDATDADALKAEIDRAHAIEGMAKSIVENANTVLTATRLRAEYTKNATVPKMLEG